MAIFQKNRKLNILFVASEAGPFMKVGGLGEVMYALPKELKALGCDARVMVPRYITMDTARFPLTLEAEGIVPLPNEADPYGLFVSNVLRHENEKGETIAYFLENMEYYEKRANVYGYMDDAVRWALLSKGTLEFLRQSSWRPDVIVACEWQAGLIPNLIATEYKNDPVFAGITTVFSIHNLAHQGMFDPHFVSEMDYDSGESPVPLLADPRLQKLNFMRRGIRYADAINTVSPTYAQEITTSEYGELLDDLLSERRSRLFGILNGIDYDSYNPATDSFLEFPYSLKTLGERRKNKAALQRKFNLPERPDTFLLGIVSRLNWQKGFHLLMNTAHALFTNLDVQLIVVGTGESEFMGFFQELPEHYPGKVAVHLAYDEALPRMVYGGADVILIPSKYEPSGLTQMEVMRYGGVPLVRKTGGLADSVENYNPRAQTGTGFVFEPFDNYAFFGAVVRAFETYQYPKCWEGIQKRVMKADFSWTKSAREYITLFKKAIEFKRNSTAR